MEERKIFEWENERAKGHSEYTYDEKFIIETITFEDKKYNVKYQFNLRCRVKNGRIVHVDPIRKFKFLEGPTDNELIDTMKKYYSTISAEAYLEFRKEFSDAYKEAFRKEIGVV